MGGPKNRFGEGYFSECVHYPDFDLAKQGLNFDDPALEPIELVNACNQILMKYIENNMHLEDFYSSCLHLGFWLHVPDDWKRYHYLT
jgi:hypothetical protein